MIDEADRTQGAFRKGGSATKGLQGMHKQLALWSIRKFRLIYPELTMTLYGTDWTFILYVANCDDEDFPDLTKFFDDIVRPMGCNVSLSQQIPPVGDLIEEIDNYEAELWLNGEPLSVATVNYLLSLAESALPEGEIDFVNDQDTWVFRSFAPLTDDEKSCVQKAAIKVGLVGLVEFVVMNAPPATPSSPLSYSDRQGDIDLAIGRHLKSAPDKLRELVHQDEDEWREFLSRRANQEIVEHESAAPEQSACLYDVEHCGDSRLSELLTIYERVDITPDRHSVNWCSKHQVPLSDLQELVRLKRVRIILPYSAAEYPSTLIEGVAEVDRSAIVLSRALAAKTIERGQKKDPFLYAPLTSSQRAAILSAMSQTVADDRYRELLRSYGDLFSKQHDMFMMRGALASFGVGVGAYLGDVFLKLGDKDGRMELMTSGAGIEWALGLGASYVPRDYGGFDETGNSEIIASFLGRTKLLPSDPVANRMHVLSDGLLAVSGVPALEVAKNFHSLPASRFRNLARKLMSATPSAAELQEAVDQINADVKTFERRSERLAAWNLQIPIAGAPGIAIGDPSVSVASVSAAWLYKMLKHKMPAKFENEVADAIAMLSGLATGSSLDAVVVSRSRKAIANN